MNIQDINMRLEDKVVPEHAGQALEHGGRERRTHHHELRHHRSPSLAGGKPFCDIAHAQPPVRLPWSPSMWLCTTNKDPFKTQLLTRVQDMRNILQRMRMAGLRAMLESMSIETTLASITLARHANKWLALVEESKPRRRRKGPL